MLVRFPHSPAGFQLRHGGASWAPWAPPGARLRRTVTSRFRSPFRERKTPGRRAAHREVRPRFGPKGSRRSARRRESSRWDPLPGKKYTAIRARFLHLDAKREQGGWPKTLWGSVLRVLARNHESNSRDRSPDPSQLGEEGRALACGFRVAVREGAGPSWQWRRKGKSARGLPGPRWTEAKGRGDARAAAWEAYFLFFFLFSFSIEFCVQNKFS